MPANRFSPKASIFPRETHGKGIPFIKIFLAADRASEVPVFWHEAYLREHGRLMEALGAWAEKNPELDFVDLGGMGEFGENHLGRWTEANKIEAGFSESVFLEALLRMMEQAERHLPQTAKAICVSPFDGPSEPLFRLVTERAVRKGWWLRTDSFTDKGSAFTTEPFFDRFDGRTPWILEPAGGINRGFFGEPISLTKYFEAIRKHQPHVVNLMGMWDLGKLKPEEQQFLAGEARRIGYRLQIQKSVLPVQVAERKGEAPAVPLSVTVAQNGAVSFMGDAVYQLRFSQEGKTVFEIPWIPEEPLLTLKPGQKRSERLYVSLPKGFPAKTTRLSLAIRDLRNGTLRPDNADTEEEFFVPLGNFSFQSGSSSGVDDCLPRLAKAVPPEGMEISRAGESVLLKGREEKGWSYAIFPGQSLRPGFTYVMKVQVRAQKTQVADSRLKFKIGVKKTGESSVRNYFTEYYEFDKAGEWQELSLSYPSREGEEIGIFAVEKGRTASSTLNAEIRSWTLEARPLAPLE
ncbi:MAG: hypothetical protein JNM63_00880 [Spirochaetia bacterium]|nr:hypothetical protein [Spirochaetia bacterium]